jgi:hypothetical protein
MKGAGVLLTAASLVAAGACGAPGEPSSQGPGSRPVTLEFWVAGIGLDKSVALWNQRAHDDIKINYSPDLPGQRRGLRQDAECRPGRQRALSRSGRLRHATEFRRTDTDSVTSLINNTGIYPAATSGKELPAANQPSAHFGGQNIYQVFRTAAANISPNWAWGPTMTQVQPDFKDGLKKAGAGQGSAAGGQGGAGSNPVVPTA